MKWFRELRRRPLSANHQQVEPSYELSDNISPLDQHLSITNPELRHALWHALTGETDTVGHLTKGTDAYFKYYAKIIDESAYKAKSIKTHLELINIVQELKTTSTREDLIRRLTQPAQDGIEDNRQSQSALPGALGLPSMNAEEAEHTICLATRVLSMSGLARPPNTVPSCYTLPWEQGCLSDRLKEVHQKRHTNDVWLKFDADKLERVGKLRIEFTDELNQHLKVHKAEKEGPETLFVFHHAKYLKAMQHGLKDQLFPPLFLQETLQTLNLLFPPYNKKVRNRFAKRIEKDDEIDRSVLDCSNGTDGIKTKSSAYPYWGEQLVSLNEVIGDAEPQSVWEAFLDPRPGLRVPIMLALTALVLTAFFGLVQSIEGAIQVYKAYEPSAGP